MVLNFVVQSRMVGHKNVHGLHMEQKRVGPAQNRIAQSCETKRCVGKDAMAELNFMKKYNLKVGGFRPCGGYQK